MMSDIYALGTFSEGSGPQWPGVVRGGKVCALETLLPDAPAQLGEIFENWSSWGDRIDEAVLASTGNNWKAETNFVAHLPYKPENLLGAGANYRRHVIQLIVDTGAGGLEHLDHDARLKIGTEIMDKRAATGKPYVFVAMRSSIAGPSTPLILPFDSTEPDWELELAVVIGKTARRVPHNEALSHVAGYMIANDITSRELVHRPDIPQMGMDWLSSKNSAGYKVLGPYITPARYVADPQKLHIRLSLNDRVMQDEGTDDMIFSVARLIEYISATVQLNPGDILMTGSPSGNGTHYNRFLQDGDVMVGEITGLVGAQVITCLLETGAPALASVTA